MATCCSRACGVRAWPKLEKNRNDRACMPEVGTLEQLDTPWPAADTTPLCACCVCKRNCCSTRCNNLCCVARICPLLFVVRGRCLLIHNLLLVMLVFVSIEEHTKLIAREHKIPSLLRSGRLVGLAWGWAIKCLHVLAIHQNHVAAWRWRCRWCLCLCVEGRQPQHAPHNLLFHGVVCGHAWTSTKRQHDYLPD